MSEHDDSVEEPQVFAVSRRTDTSVTAGEMGYSRRDFLELAGLAAGVAVATIPRTGAAETFGECTVTGQKLNVRKGPGNRYPVLDTLVRDDRVKVVARNAESTWYKVEADTVTGWVEAKHLDCPDPSALDRAPVAEVEPPPGRTPAPNATPAGPHKPRPQGKQPRGKRRIRYSLHGRTFTLPCGSKIPGGAVCTCNCVAVPGPSRTVCTCNKVCTCQSVGPHYWYPN
jgi:hypothetical protein